jgi:EpsD family peptidyl-prolyl cis-trans isomerase
MPTASVLVAAVWPFMALALLLGGCSKDGPPEESQVAVRVNDGEISIHQVQAVLRRQPQLAANANADVAARVLEVLVDQELAAQAAVAGGLDKQSDVIQSLQVSRRESLARAYHERIADKVIGPGSDDIDRYYDSHPALFAQRRLYLLQESAVEASDAQVQSLKAIVAKVQGAADLASAMDRLGLRFTTRQFAQAAEDVPLLLLQPLSAAEVGQSLLFAQPGGARIFTVLHAHPAPVYRRTAAKAIGNYLLEERKRERVGEAMAALRKEARLQYAAAFAHTPAAASAPASAAPAAAPR